MVTMPRPYAKTYAQARRTARRGKVCSTCGDPLDPRSTIRCVRHHERALARQLAQRHALYSDAPRHALVGFRTACGLTTLEGGTRKTIYVGCEKCRAVIDETRETVHRKAARA
jgi:hypothetical protein